MTGTQELTIQERNAETVRSWIEEASGGFLTGIYSPDVLHPNFQIGRADGEPLDGTDISPSWVDDPVYNVLFDVFVSTFRVLDRRYRRSMAEVRDDVRTVLVRYVSREQIPDSAITALRIFELRHGLR